MIRIARTSLLAAIVAAASPTLADDAPNPQEMFERWQTYGSPNEERMAALASFVGEWDTTIRTLTPGAPPVESSGSTTYSWLMEGRWLAERTTGEMMGMPYDAYGIFGYDQFKKKYVTVHVNNMGTAIHTAEGNSSADADAMLLFGSMDEFITGEHDKAVKYVTRILDEDEHILEVHDLTIADGDTKVMEFVRRRAK